MFVEIVEPTTVNGRDNAQIVGPGIRCRRFGWQSVRAQSQCGYAGASAEIKTLSEIDLAQLPRQTTGMAEFDRVLGGGLVAGSAILVGGHPGAGKSTLLLQVMCFLAATQSALYVTGEESLQQVAMRADRLGLPSDKLQMMAETHVESILAAAHKAATKGDGH